MTVLLIIVSIIIVLGLIGKVTSKSTKNRTSIPNTTNQPHLDIRITSTSSDTNSTQNQATTSPPIRQDNNGFWILNPSTPFELTVMTKAKNIAQTIRKILDDSDLSDSKKQDKLLAMYATYNIKIKEIEEYKAKYKSQYFAKIEELKNSFGNWQNLGELDKEDLLCEFREKAVNVIYERADCELDVLFEYEAKDTTLADEFVIEYGFENIQTYINYGGHTGKVRSVPNDAYSRQMFENLAELGLAIRGSNLSIEEILLTLTLKELNDFAANPDKVFRRKNQAVEYIINNVDIDKKIGNFVSLRGLFKLNPLPEKYASLDFHAISDTWEYYTQEINLLTRTYLTSFYQWQELQDREYVQYYTVSPMDKENPCPCAKSRMSKRYYKSTPPKIPFHVGCTCWMNTKHKI
jgi:hypothetical protein